MLKLVIVPATILLLLAGLFWYHTEDSKEPEQSIQTSGAFKALELWSLERSYPRGKLPSKSHFAAFEQAKVNLHKRSGQLKEQSPWYPIGPHNLAGRTLAIAFNPQNPNTIFAGSASGGLWRSYSAGRGAAAWQRIQTGYSVLGVSSIEFLDRIVTFSNTS